MSDLKEGQNGKVSFKWSISEVIKGKTFPILVATYVSHILLENLCIKWFESQMIFFNSIGLSIVSLVCYLPAILVGILVVWLYQNSKDVSKMMVVGVSTEELERREKQFKWHGLFGLVIGYILWGLVTSIVMPIAREMMNAGNSMGWIIFFVLIIGVPVLIIATYNPINKKMVKKTRTNAELIEEYKAGLYDQLIPEDCANTTDKIGILVCLEKAEAHTVRGAIYVHRVKRFLKGFGKASGVVGKIAAVLLLIVTFGVVNNLSKEIGDAIDDAFRR